MGNILSNCVVCGERSLTSEQVRLVICSVPERTYYSFTCETCNDVIELPASQELVTQLIAVGVVPEELWIPAEALEEHDGRKVTYDDVLDFALALGKVDLLAALIEPRR